MDEFKVIKSKRVPPAQQEKPKVDVVTPRVSVSPETRDRMLDAVADNFDSIVHLAADYMEIQKMKTQSEAVIAQMRETRKQLIDEAEAYAIRKNAETTSIVQRMHIIREMMNDFYQYSSQQSLTSEDFCKIITEIVNQMGRLSEDEQ